MNIWKAILVKTSAQTFFCTWCFVWHGHKYHFNTYLSETGGYLLKRAKWSSYRDLKIFNHLMVQEVVPWPSYWLESQTRQVWLNCPWASHLTLRLPALRTPTVCCPRPVPGTSSWVVVIGYDQFCCDKSSLSHFKYGVWITTEDLPSITLTINLVICKHTYTCSFYFYIIVIREIDTGVWSLEKLKPKEA